MGRRAAREWARVHVHVPIPAPSDQRAYLKIELRVECAWCAVKRCTIGCWIDSVLPPDGVRAEENDRVIRGESRIPHSRDKCLSCVRGCGEESRRRWGGSCRTPGEESKTRCPRTVRESDRTSELNASEEC